MPACAIVGCSKRYSGEHVWSADHHHKSVCKNKNCPTREGFRGCHGLIALPVSVMSSNVEDPSEEFSLSRELLPEDLTAQWDIGNEQNWLKSRSSQDPDSFISLEQFLHVEPPSRSSSDDSYKSTSNELHAAIEKVNEIPSPPSVQNRRLSYTLPNPSVFVVNTPDRDHSLLSNVTPPSAYSKVSNLTLSETPISDPSFVRNAKKQSLNLEESGALKTTRKSANSPKTALGIINEHDLDSVNCIKIDNPTTIDSDLNPQIRRVERDAVPPSMNVSFVLISPDGGSEINDDNHENPIADHSVMECDKPSNIILDAHESHSNFDIIRNNIEPHNTSSLDMAKSNVATEFVDGMKPPSFTGIQLFHGNTFTVEDPSHISEKGNFVNSSWDFPGYHVKMDNFFPDEKGDRKEKIASEDNENDIDDVGENAVTDGTPTMNNTFSLDEKVNSSHKNSSSIQSASFDEEEQMLLDLCATPKTTANGGRTDVEFSKMPPPIGPHISPSRGPGCLLRRGTFVCNNSFTSDDMFDGMTLQNRGLLDTTDTSSSLGNLVSHINTGLGPKNGTIPQEQSKRPLGPCTSYIRKPSLVPISSVPDIPKEVRLCSSTSPSLSNLTIKTHRPRPLTKIPIPARMRKLYK